MILFAAEAARIQPYLIQGNVKQPSENQLLYARLYL